MYSVASENVKGLKFTSNAYSDKSESNIFHFILD